MNRYMELKIKKKYLIIFSIVFVLLCSLGGYYIWCSYHPDIYIQIGDGPTGKEGINIEAPNIAFTGHGIAEPSSNVELKLQNITLQHEFICEYIKNTYKTADIKLDINVTDAKTILRYYGKATTLQEKTIDFEKEVTFDFVLDANIKHM